MEGSNLRRWIGAALLVAGVYFVAGVVFAALAKGGPSPRPWRLAAWAISAITFVGHVIHERSRKGHSPAASAFHVAIGAAIGACLLAVVATLRSISSGTGNTRLLSVAIVAWPLLTAIPAFIVAFGIAAWMGRKPPNA